MIRFENVSLTYTGALRPVLHNVDLTVNEGELALVVGRTGAGKSTLLRAVNGLVPHFTGGTLDGRVLVDGHDTRTHAPRDLAAVVGMVGQDPLAGFVTDTVEEELAYAMEQLAVPASAMRTRVEETLDLLGIADLRHRFLRTLSGGQQQRVAIGSVLTTNPRVLVLDEPTSALDPSAAEDVLAAITRLVHDLGITALVAEHRMERVVQYADRLIVLTGEGTVVDGPPADVVATSPVAPPVVDLGRLAGWSPLPLSVRDARRVAAPLREKLEAVPSPRDRGDQGGYRDDSAGSRRRLPTTTPALAASNVVVRHGDVVAVRDVSVDLWPGEIVALMGRNGSGKSSLLWSLQGSGPRTAGSVVVAGSDPKRITGREARRLVGLVPQTASDLLYLETVDDECAAADTEADVEPGSCQKLLDRIAPGIDGARHPRDLSEGQRLGLVLAVQLVGAPEVVLLDEPTRGMDYTAKRHLGQIVEELAGEGTSVVVATHDVEFAAAVAHRVIVMAEGDVVADGPAPEVIGASPAFAPQVAKVLGSQRWLTVDDVATALNGAGS